ncbi:MAG: hypothetical protein IJ203_11625 [Atopobiaceae bacterium]|jgi:hypothetical protein|nr:hypothetical protein [Atopobiaceae bacterium]
MGMTIDELLEMPYWVVDILPRQVPADSPGQYFAVERHYLEESQFAQVKQRHIDLVLKLNCYFDLALDDEQEVNPSPARVVQEMNRRYVCIRMGDALIVSEPDDTCLTIYNPNDELLALVRQLAMGEGLYLWQP